jgi:hypothetical protein
MAATINPARTPRNLSVKRVIGIKDVNNAGAITNVGIITPFSGEKVDQVVLSQPSYIVKACFLCADKYIRAPYYKNNHKRKKRAA